jgi:hypothetical protein
MWVVGLASEGRRGFGGREGRRRIGVAKELTDRRRVVGRELDGFDFAAVGLVRSIL